jgi:hypothetical protein
MIEGIDNGSPETMAQWTTWVREAWYPETGNLFQHPDFVSWFMEQGDDPAVTRILQQVVLLTEELLEQETEEYEDFIETLENLADNLMLELLETQWKDNIIDRLIDTACLLEYQNTHTFRNLAATEAYKLTKSTDPKVLLTGFTKTYGRRCIAEELLRLRQGSAVLQQLTPIVDTVLDRWGF